MAVSLVSTAELEERQQLIEDLSGKVSEAKAQAGNYSNLVLSRGSINPEACPPAPQPCNAKLWLTYLCSRGINSVNVNNRV